MSAVAAPRPTIRSRVRSVCLDCYRTIVRDPIRDNRIRSFGAGPGAALAVTIGLLACAVPMVIIAGASWWSTSDPLWWPGFRGGSVSYLPGWLIPVTATVLIFGLSVSICGSVFARRWLAAAAATGSFLLSVVLTGYAWQTRDHGVAAWIGVIATVGTLLIPALRWTRPSPAAALLASLLCGTGVVLPAITQLLTRPTLLSGAQLGPASTIDAWNLTINQAASLSLVAAVVAGLGAVSFAVTLTRLAARSFRTLTYDRRGWLAGAVAGALGLNCWVAVSVVAGWVGGRTLLMQLAGLLATAVLVGVAMLWWFWAAARSHDPQDGADAADAPIAMLLFAVPLMVLLFLLLPTEISLFGGDLAGMKFAVRIVDFLNNPILVRSTRLLVAVGLIGWSALRARRRPGPIPGFLGLAGLVIAVQTLADWWTVPATVVLQPAHVQLIVTMSVLVTAGIALVRHRWPSTNRLLAALGLLLFVSLVLNNTFIADPFALALGATGPVFLLFGLVWAFLTTGAHGRMSGVAGFGRSLVLLGYATVPLLVLAWRAGTAQTDPIGGLAGQLGARLLGRALVLAVVASWLMTVLPWHRLRRPAPVAAPVTADPPTIPIVLSPADSETLHNTAAPAA